MKTIEGLQTALTENLTPRELAQTRHLRSTLNNLGLMRTQELLDKLKAVRADSLLLVNALDRRQAARYGEVLTDWPLEVDVSPYGETDRWVDDEDMMGYLVLGENGNVAVYLTTSGNLVPVEVHYPFDADGIAAIRIECDYTGEPLAKLIEEAEAEREQE